MGDFFIRFVTFTSTLVVWLIILPPRVDWDIMGYASDPLTSHIWLSNRSCTLNFKIYTFISWSLYLLSQILIPPQPMSDISLYP